MSSLKGSIKDRLGPKSSNEKVTTALNSSGTICRTVFDPSKLKKTNTKPLSENPTSNLASKEAKTKMQQKAEFSKKKRQMLDECLKQHKSLTEFLSKAKDEKERQMIKGTIEKVFVNIEQLKNDIAKYTNELLEAKKSNDPKSKEEIMEELLNADLELHIKEQNNDPSSPEVALKVADLRKRAKSFGISNYNSLTSRALRISSMNLSRGRGRRGFRGMNSLHKVDRRTRKILIPDLGEDDATDLLEVLAVINFCHFAINLETYLICRFYYSPFVKLKRLSLRETNLV